MRSNLITPNCIRYNPQARRRGAAGVVRGVPRSKASSSVRQRIAEVPTAVTGAVGCLSLLVLLLLVIVGGGFGLFGGRSAEIGVWGWSSASAPLTIRDAVPVEARAPQATTVAEAVQQGWNASGCGGGGGEGVAATPGVSEPLHGGVALDSVSKSAGLGAFSTNGSGSGSDDVAVVDANDIVRSGGGELLMLFYVAITAGDYDTMFTIIMNRVSNYFNVWLAPSVIMATIATIAMSVTWLRGSVRLGLGSGGAEADVTVASSAAQPAAPHGPTPVGAGGSVAAGAVTAGGAPQVRHWVLFTHEEVFVD